MKPVQYFTELIDLLRTRIASCEYDIQTKEGTDKMMAELYMDSYMVKLNAYNKALEALLTKSVA